MGPFPIASLGGSKYLVSVFDEFSSYGLVFPIKTKAAVSDVCVTPFAG
jgi:hypothetical protein